MVPSPAELALLTNKPRAATVTATSDVVCAGEVGRGGIGQEGGREGLEGGEGIRVGVMMVPSQLLLSPILLSP